MITYKTDKELEIMAAGGQILRDVFQRTLQTVKVGMTTEHIDKTAEKLILEAGAEPAFKRVKGYDWTTCICINDQVVHTPPSKRMIKDGDILTVDMGVFYNGFNTDKADTVIVGTGRSEFEQFLKKGRQTLTNALQKARVGNRIGHISETIQAGIEEAGFYVIRDLTGHGVGRVLHEEPFIPGVKQGSIDRTPEIRAGMALAVEVIYAQSKTGIVEEEGQSWSLVTKNNCIAACFEDTIGLFENKAFILT